MMQEVGSDEQQGKASNIVSQLQEAALTNVTQGRPMLPTTAEETCNVTALYIFFNGSTGLQ